MQAGAITPELCAERISAVLRRKFQWMRSADKWLAGRIGSDVRAAQNYIYGRHCPPASKLIEMMAECDELAEEINNLVMERRKARDANVRD